MQVNRTTKSSLATGLSTFKLRPFRNILDGLLIVFVGFIGLLGSFYLYQSCGEKASTSNDNVYKSQFAPILHMNTPVFHNKKALAIDGKKKVGSNIEFKIQEYNPSLKYQLDLGNGLVKSFESDHFVYPYSEGGNYQVALEVSYKDQKRVIYKENLSIREESPLKIAGNL